ncbi:hypothetical protein CD175_06240 [Pseudomonas laurylsulfatiphila]|uniref:Uncharacterized protein n=1 Tax=Pseudomonas laurylsulfatiphila TaxID=2011015 RepID=A0A2S6FNP7_9PSED|nr:hypothetical protein CD175_06240 [Pseudomonas laurylsulfatiphila]
MVVNDNAGELDKRGALESIASRLAPTVLAWARSFVGAGLPAMVVNDNGYELGKPGLCSGLRGAELTSDRGVLAHRLIQQARHHESDNG